MEVCNNFELVATPELTHDGSVTSSSINMDKVRCQRQLRSARKTTGVRRFYVHGGETYHSSRKQPAVEAAHSREATG